MDQSTIVTEHDCNVLGGLFQIIINDLKNGTSTWDDFILKATKLQTQLKSTITASTAFLDAFQKVADMATSTRGGTKEIGTALTRLCLRQRSVEAKLKSFSSTFLDCLIIPLQERSDEWKKATVQLDKERTKELKRLRQEFKKRQYCDGSSLTGNSGSFRNKKQTSSSRLSKGKFDFFDSLNSKGIYGTIGHKSSLSRSLDSEMECNERLLLLEELEKKAVRRALIEERSHFCLLVNYLRPLIEEEVSMIQEISHIQEIMESLLKLTAEPFDLPVSSENVLSQMKLNKNDSLAWNLHTPPSSPSSLGSRKSSMCSISSYNSSSSSGNNNNNVNNHQNQTYGQKYFGSTTEIPVAGNYDDNKYSNDSGELQFHIDTQTENGHRERTPIKIHSTNPFLNSYNQINHDQSLYDTADSQTTLTPSNQTYGGGGLFPNQESDGSITPTNADLRNSAFINDNRTGGNHRSTKPPPAPPVRRTSSLSNPNAITLGTLKTAAMNSGKNYDDICKNLSLYDEINVLTKSMNDINFTLKNTDFTTTNTGKSVTGTADDVSSGGGGEKSTHYDPDSSNDGGNRQPPPPPPSAPAGRDKNSDIKVVKKLFENLQHQPSSNNNHYKSFEDENSQLPLPAPPPEAFVADTNVAGIVSASVASLSTTTTTTATSTAVSASPNSGSQAPHHHYNKITNVHREFLETLNSKLSQSPLVHQNNVRAVSKRRSSQQNFPDDYGAGGVPSNSSSSGKHRNSNRSASASRTSSRKNSLEKQQTAFSIAGSPVAAGSNESFVDKLSQSLLLQQHKPMFHHHHHHQYPADIGELAKAAASNALQRKQSVPDLNELNHHYHNHHHNNQLKNQNRVTFSSSLNLSSSSSNQTPFQVVEIQTNSTQQPIYASRNQLHQELQELYGTVNSNSSGNIYNTASSSSSTTTSSSYFQNGFLNKL